MSLENNIGFCGTDNAMRRKYRNVFNNPQGRDVLRNILNHCGYFESVDPDDRDKMILRRFAEELVLNLAPVSRDNDKAITVTEMRDKQLEAQIDVLCSLSAKEEE